MKRILFTGLSLALLCNAESIHAQNGMWAWMRGDTITSNTIGVWGVQGISDPSNTPPGIYEGAQWTDLNGDFWLYGGLQVGNGNEMATLWRYQPSTNEWTWMSGFINPIAGHYGVQGIPSVDNHPGARAWGCNTWTDLNGNLWLLGGYGVDGYGLLGFMNDLWMYNIATNEWTWMKGSKDADNDGNFGQLQVPSPQNNPPAVNESSASWVDHEGNLWQFGGDNWYVGHNNVWKYDLSINEWTWMKGSSQGDVAPHYGTMGVEDSLNDPGSRNAYAAWVDPQDNLWTFGGVRTQTAEVYGDMWKFNTQTMNWTWMNGDSIPNGGESAVGDCITDSANHPAARYENRACWQDDCGNFWMFGGDHTFDFFTDNRLSDLWRFSVSSNKWTWVQGSLFFNQLGHYGTKGVPAVTNHPGNRYGSVSWTDLDGNYWLFGGTEQFDYFYSDVWKFIPDYSCGIFDTCVVLPQLVSSAAVCEKYCVNFFDTTSTSATSWHWYFQGGDPDSSFQQNPTHVCYDVPGTYDVRLIACNASSCDTFFYDNLITVYPTPPSPAITQNGNWLTCTPSYSYQWQLNGVDIPGASSQSYFATLAGFYTVFTKDVHGCTNYTSFQFTYVEDIQNNISLTLYPVPSMGNVTIKISLSIPSQILVRVQNVIGQPVYESEPEFISTELSKTIDLHHLASGIYAVQVFCNGKSITKKLVID